MISANDRDVVIGIKGLTKFYGDLAAVDDLTLDIRRGEILGFLGPNGAGKSTSINMICGLIRPDQGEIMINGRIAGQNFHHRQLFGLCPQELIYWPRLTCLEQLVFMGEMYDMPAIEARKSGLALLEYLGLTTKTHKLAGTLSGGMKRKLNIALALVHKPDIVVLDEPEAGLDPQGRIMVREFIRGMRLSKTVILTTHNMDEADRLSDRVAIMDNGKLLLMDTPDNLKKVAGSGDVLEICMENGPSEDIQDIEQSLKTLTSGIVIGDNQILVRERNGVGLIPRITAILDEKGVKITEIRVRTNTLEDVFIQLTGKKLRE
jgi:ABC-2 type transport system ATP-binding protein